MGTLPANPNQQDAEPPHPWLGEKVTYKYGHCDWGTGELVYACEFNGLAKVRDDVDGQLWFGLLDHVELDTGDEE